MLLIWINISTFAPWHRGRVARQCRRCNVGEKTIIRKKMASLLEDEYIRAIIHVDIFQNFSSLLARVFVLL